MSTPSSPEANDIPKSALDMIQNLVRSDEVDMAIDRLIDVLKGARANEVNESILFASRLMDINRQERAGLLSRSDATVERNRLKVSVLDLAEKALQKLENNRTPISTSSITFTPPLENQLEKIFGTNHLRSIAWLSKGLEAAKSVCRIVTPNGMGSGFLVDSSHILTNWHVVPDVATLRNTTIEFNFEEDLFGRIKPVLELKLNSEVFWTDKILDFSLLKLMDTSNILEDLSAPLSKSSPGVQIGDHVIIIQHPQGGPKQIALTANQVVNIFEHRLQYTTDTLPGSSGSPVFNDKWEVVAIHHAGGNLICNSRGDRMFANEGILLCALLDHLLNKGITIPMEL